MILIMVVFLNDLCAIDGECHPFELSASRVFHTGLIMLKVFGFGCDVNTNPDSAPSNSKL